MFCQVSGQFPQWFSAPSSTILVLEVPWMAFFYFCRKCENLCVSYANPGFDKAQFTIWHRCYSPFFSLSNHFFYFSPNLCIQTHSDKLCTYSHGHISSGEVFSIKRGFEWVKILNYTRSKCEWTRISTMYLKQKWNEPVTAFPAVLLLCVLAVRK
jgi:hypothetical protein